MLSSSGGTDNPMMEERAGSLEIAVVRLEERLVSLTRDLVGFRAETKISHSELRSSMQLLETRERERNGHIRRLMDAQTAYEQRWNEHMLVARNEAERLVSLEDQHYVSGIKSSVLKGQMKLIFGGAGIGGLIIGAVQLIFRVT